MRVGVEDASETGPHDPLRFLSFDLVLTLGQTASDISNLNYSIRIADFSLFTRPHCEITVWIRSVNSKKANYGKGMCGH